MGAQGRIPGGGCGGSSPPPIMIFSQMDKMFFDKNCIKFQKWSYLHERCGMCWNDWKINFPIFSFWDMVVFYTQDWAFPQPRICSPPPAPQFWSILKKISSQMMRTVIFFCWISVASIKIHVMTFFRASSVILISCFSAIGRIYHGTIFHCFFTMILFSIVDFIWFHLFTCR